MAKFTITGWKLAREDREKLLQQFPSRYGNTIADHVTFHVGGGPDTPLPPHVEAEVVGQADDGKSLECLVTSIDGSTDRPDGSTYHITWSLGPGRRAKESNDVLRDRGWNPIETPIPIHLEPARWP
jgi:hypothetical protein